MNLAEFYLHNNQFDEIDISLLTSVEHLDMSNNNLKGSISFYRVAELKELKVRGNVIKSLTINSNLLKLDASDNTERFFNISFMDNVAITHLTVSNLELLNYNELLAQISELRNLKVLDLSDNNLEYIDLKYHKLPNTLQALNLFDTDLHSIFYWKNIKDYLPNLRSINMQGNFLKCDELNDMIQIFNDLNINVTGSDKNSDFVLMNCAHDTHRKRQPAQKFVYTKTSKNVILWILVTICVLGYLIGTAFYFNKKYKIAAHIHNGQGLNRIHIINNNTIHRDHGLLENEEN
jgi:Leucine-rich repeat (LRR) protein